MNNPVNVSGISRRQFLVRAGLATGVMASWPLQAQARFLWDGHAPLTVGVIAPDSTLYPSLGKNLVAGIRLAFDEAGWRDTALLVEQSDASSSIASAVTLLSGKRVDLLTGMINPLKIHPLLEQLEQSGTVFINMEGGANGYIPRDQSPLVFHNSLGYWQANWALGSWAASAVGKRGFVAASLYESGYDAYYAFPQGFEQAGGRIFAREISLMPGKEALEPLLTAIRSARPDFVFASYSGLDAVAFVRAYAAAGLAGRIPLITSGFTVDDALLAEMGSSATGIRSALSWSPALASSGNSAFCTAYSARTGRQADQFALLGYDTGTLITSAVKGAKGSAIRGETLKQALEKTSIATPRGTLRVDPGSGCIDSPLYLREVRREGGAFCNAIVSQLSTLDAIAKKADFGSMTARSGWTSSYLCV